MGPRHRLLLRFGYAAASAALACAGPPAGARTGTPSATAASPACGDGTLEPGEACPLTWVSGDTHIHGRGCGGNRSPAELVHFLVRRGLGVGSALIWGEGYEDRVHFTGRDDPASVPGHILRYDLEVSDFAADRGGHLVLLGLTSIDFSPNPFATPKSSIPVSAWARAQGKQVLLGMAHSELWPEDGSFPRPPADCCTPWELPVHAALGRLDFIETAEHGRKGPIDEGSLFLWSKLLNSGFRIALVGASDFPCLDEPVEATPRTSVFLDGAPTYERFLEAVRRGRTVVSIGPRDGLDLRVGGSRLGEEVRARAGEVLSATVESEFAEPGDVQILVNGRPLARVTLGRGPQSALIPISLGSSAWVSARSPRALTSPVYVVVDDRPIRASAEDACYWIRYVDHLTGLVERRLLDLGESTPEALAAYREARGVFVSRFTETGGGICR